MFGLPSGAQWRFQDLFESLKEKCSLLILVGHSLGGAMASLYAAVAEEWGLKGADYL